MNNYLLLEVSGTNINGFLLKCNYKRINIIKIKYVSYKKVIIKVNKKDYKNIKRIGLKYKIKIINETGIDYYKYLFFKYRVFIIVFLLGLFLLIVLSNIIFDLEIIGENNILNKEIIKELEKNNIQKFKFKKSYKEINKIKNRIKKKFNDNIEWIEIKENGVKYEVYIVERKKNKKNSNTKIYTIISKKNAVIKDIYTYKGVSLVDIDNYVNKGDILISSDILLNDEVKDRYSADGKVYGECWYKVRVEYPLKYKEVKYTNNNKKTLYIKIGNKYYEIVFYKNYNRKNILSINNKSNSIKFGLEEVKQIEYINKEYSNNEALKEAENEAKKQISNRLKEDERILSQKTLKFYSNGSKIIVDIFFSVYEEIGEKRIIEMGEVDDTKDIN